MKRLLIILMAIILFISLTSCADSKTFTIDGKDVAVEPYGWVNTDVKKVEGIKYQVCFGNVVWSVIGVETVVVPIWLTGYELFEPVELTKNK